MTGTVKNWFPDRGFGFIETREYRRDVFVHFKSLADRGQRELFVGEPVEFELQETPKGPAAVNVRRR